MEIKNFTEEPPVFGLEDKGHVILSCSSCGQGLVDIWLVKDNPRLKWKGKAKCWKCGDQSFVKEWTGQFALGHYGKNRPGADPKGEMDSKMESIICRQEIAGDTIIFHTRKAN